MSDRQETSGDPGGEDPWSTEIGTITRLLDALKGGRKEAEEELYTCVYNQLRSMAQNQLRKEPRKHTLQPTELVHEAFLRLVNEGRIADNRSTFLRFAARAMRNLLVDYARTRGRLKRPEGRAREELPLSALAVSDAQLDLVAIDEAFKKLRSVHELAAQCFEYSFFVGLNNGEIGELLGIDRRDVGTQLRVAKAWLSNWLRKGEEDGADAEHRSE